MKTKPKHLYQTKEQLYSRRRFEALDELAKKAGFDGESFAYTEFCLMPLFEIIVEECAKVVEDETGCKHSAESIRNFAKTIGNR
jgi:hypothetical protein